ncbi:MAG: hypothetical protein ABR550_08145 [Wenzhouxiangellaceae bacterium]
MIQRRRDGHALSDDQIRTLLSVRRLASHSLEQLLPHAFVPQQLLPD